MEVVSMAKVRIYALAKELEVQSKDVIHFLAEKNIEIKSPQSSVDDEIVALVKNNFKAGTRIEKIEMEKSNSTTIKNPENETQKTEEKTEEQPKKKSNISVVFNPQNSKMAGKKQRHQRQNGNYNSSNQGNRTTNEKRQNIGEEKQKQNIQETRSASERAEAVKASFDRILGENSQKKEEKTETAKVDIISVEKSQEICK